jgi:hypothetical protein
MPADFEKCVRDGGNVVTEKVGKDKYRHVCYLDKKRYAGEVKTKKKK